MKKLKKKEVIMNKIVIAAANGYLGRLLIHFFVNKGYEVVGLCRKPNNLGNAKCVLWDGRTLGTWAKELEGATALVNLAGKSVDCRYTEENKRLIISSRIESTKVLGKSVTQCKTPPKAWLNASSATVYRHAEDRAMDEETGEIGKGFSVEVCKAWEQAFFDCKTPQTRKAALRISFVLGNNGGAYPMLKKLVKLGMGGKMAKGTQYISWIHEADFCNALLYIIEKNISGAVNIAAPQPEPNNVFMGIMRQVYGVPFGLPQPKWFLEVGAVLLQTETELILKSRRVVPAKLEREGFTFSYPTLEGALKKLNG